MTLTSSEKAVLRILETFKDDVFKDPLLRKGKDLLRSSEYTAALECFEAARGLTSDDQELKELIQDVKLLRGKELSRKNIDELPEKDLDLILHYFISIGATVGATSLSDPNKILSVETKREVIKFLVDQYDEE